MRPDQRWFPTNRVERAAWFANFTNGFEKVALSLGFTQDDIDAVKADNAVVQFLASAAASHKVYSRTLTAFQKSVLFGKRSPLVANFPAPPDLTPPPMVARGIFERLERLVRRIRTMPGYNSAIGAGLGIIPRNPSRKTPPDFVPKFNVKPHTMPYTFVVSTVKLHHKIWRVEILRKGQTKWENVDYFTTPSGRVTITPSNPGEPEMIQVRVRMRINNKDVGQYSNIQTVTLTP